MTRVLLISVVVLWMSGCSLIGSIFGSGEEAEAPPVAARSIPHAVEASEYLKAHDNPRLKYLLDKAHEVTINAPVNIYVFPSLFVLMEAFEKGEVDVTDLKRSYLYFEDPDGAGARGGQVLETGFECRYVDDVSDIPLNKGTGDTVYEARYVNKRLGVDPFVIWVNKRPHKGERLDVDFLMYFTAISFETEDGKSRNGILFVRPPWSGKVNHAAADRRPR